MKNFSVIFLLFSFILTACNSKSAKEENTEVMPVEGDTLVLGTDTVITQQTDTVNPVINAPYPNAHIIVDKPNLKLYVINGSDTLFKAPVCAARNRGDKRAKDDRRTPEGDFTITHIHNATDWLYHTDDGRWVPHVYGPWFLRLDAKGWQGIGIHGTNAPAQIGQRRSKGCIRMNNKDIEKVHEYAFVGMKVTVLPDTGNWDYTPVASSKTSSNKKADAEKKDGEKASQAEEAAPATKETPAEESKVESAPPVAPAIPSAPESPQPAAEQ